LITLHVDLSVVKQIHVNIHIITSRTTIVPWYIFQKNQFIIIIIIYYIILSFKYKMNKWNMRTGKVKIISTLSYFIYYGFIIKEESKITRIVYYYCVTWKNNYLVFLFYFHSYSWVNGFQIVFIYSFHFPYNFQLYSFLFSLLQMYFSFILFFWTVFLYYSLDNLYHHHRLANPANKNYFYYFCYNSFI